MKKYLLPPKTRALVNHYFNLRVKKRVISCPYYQNVWKRRKPAVFAGKGRPGQIEAEIEHLLQLKPVLDRAPDNLLRFYLVQAGLGVDCSGLVSNILAELVRETIKKDFYQLVPLRVFPGWRRRLIFKLWPKLNLSAQVLTDPPLSRAIDWSQALPGDLIKFGDSHVALISTVWRENDEIRKMEYVHSTSDYGDQHGVRRGLIFVKNPSLSLERQLWQENDSRGYNWTRKDYLGADSSRRGVRRLVIMTK